MKPNQPIISLSIRIIRPVAVVLLRDGRQG